MDIAKFLRFCFLNLGFHKINPKIYIPKIESEINLGVPKSKIFEKLSQDTEEQEELAFLINSLTSKAKKLQNKKLNTFLIVLVSLNLLIFLITLSLQSLFWLMLIIFLIVQLRKFRARAYFFVMVYGVLFIVLIIIGAGEMIEETIDHLIVFIMVSYFLLMVLLARKIKSDLYPNYTYLGPRLDENGKYIFTD